MDDRLNQMLYFGMTTRIRGWSTTLNPHLSPRARFWLVGYYDPRSRWNSARKAQNSGSGRGWWRERDWARAWRLCSSC